MPAKDTAPASKAASKGPTKATASAQGSAKGASSAPSRRRGPRYTPPTAKDAKRSPLWVPVSMFTCLVLGIAVIAGNYLQLLPGGETSNNYLIIGLVLLIAGFVLSTSFR